MQDHFDFDEDGIISDSDMQKIENFEIYDTYNIKNFNGIEKAINIKKVSIYNFNNINLTAIFELSNVESLELHGSDYNISGIEKLTKLETLELYQNSSNSYIAGLNSIKKLNLKRFSVNMYDNSFDLNLISNMTSLQDLSIEGKMSNQQVLNNLQQIISLSITNANIIEIGCFTNLTNLQRLNLRKNKITNISELASLMNLKYLNIQNNPININSEENKKVYDMIIQNGGQVEVDEYDDSEIIEIQDEELKESLIESNSIDTNNDGEISKKELERIKSIYIDTNYNVKSFDGLQYAKNLTSFSIRYNSDNTGILFEPLYNLPELKELRIYAYTSEGFDTNILNNFKNLENLCLDGRVKNQNLIWNLTQLKSLTIYGAYYDWDFNGLQNLNNLEYLYITNGLNRIFDLNLIANMTKLQNLSISGQIANQQVLNNLQQITSLSLTNAYIVNLDFLTNLTNLQRLYLTKNKITNITGLEKLKII